MGVSHLEKRFELYFVIYSSDEADMWDEGIVKRLIKITINNYKVKCSLRN